MMTHCKMSVARLKPTLRAGALLPLLMVMLLLTGCVHEFPEAEDVGPIIPPEPTVERHLNLRLDMSDMELYKYVNLDKENSSTRSAAAEMQHHMRYVVRAYPLVDFRGNSRTISRAPVDCAEAVTDISGDLIKGIPLNLPEGDYELLAWVEYVSYDYSQDFYHTTSDLTEIHLIGGPDTPNYVHEGNNPWRVAWRGKAIVSVNEDGDVYPEGSTEPVTELEVNMLRPMARYHFVTTDLEEFIKNQSQMLAPPNPGEAPPIQINLDDYEIRMVYTAYMPYAYNAHTDKPIDSLTGVSYTGTIKRRSKTEAELGFDYVFVNGSETSVQVALQLYRKADGALLSSTGSINVPLVRGKYTIVSGRFLTTKAGAGMGVNPDFFDDYNIEIH